MMNAAYLRYSDDLERIAPDEAQTAEKIVTVMSKGAEVVREREGRALRSSHAKAHALARGELRVAEGLPAELAQGLFARARAYEVIARLAHVPGELLDDRRVSTPRGLALKVLGVEGEMLPGHRGETSQDWLLDTGEVFIASDVKTFLGEITMTEASTPMPETVKQVVSVMSRANNAALHALGADSANMDFFGHPKRDPLTETYYSQTPIRYGDHVAKLRLRPLTASPDQDIAIDSPDGLRERVGADLASRGAAFALEAQLCTDLERMPIEDAHARWSQDESPYREIAKLVIPPQTATPDDAEDRLSFSPAHSLAAHRPLGSINRARMRVYPLMAEKRRALNGLPTTEPSATKTVVN